MKRLTCEMCGSNDLIKQDGVFVCQSCGCKYSVEEAKKLMIEGPVEVTGKIAIDNKENISNLLRLGWQAQEMKEDEKVIEYARKALENDSACSEAWYLMMVATDSSIKEPKYKEVVSYGKNAIAYAGDEYEQVSDAVYSFFAKLALTAFESLNHVIDKNFTGSIERYDFYTEKIRQTQRAFMNTYDKDRMVRKWEGMRNESVQNLLIDPVNRYLAYKDEIFRLIEAIPDDGLNSEDDFLVLNDCVKENERTLSLYNKYLTRANCSLTDKAEEDYKAKINLIQDILLSNRNNYYVREKERAIEKENKHKEQLDKYWSEHVEEKENLDRQLKELNKEIDNQNELLEEKTREFNKISIRNWQFPLKEKDIEIRNAIRELDKQINKLGLLKSKEKKMLLEQRNELAVQRIPQEQLDQEMQEAEKAINSSRELMQEEMKSIKKKLLDLNAQKNKITDSLELKNSINPQ